MFAGMVTTAIISAWSLKNLHGSIQQASTADGKVIIALSAGPWDALFGKGILPAFALASRIAFDSLTELAKQR
ncbi:hypothetical protein ZIOFF_023564 [Zingiber officinale]|uniref:Uncharacterized protein n=1 Tax=Zingiber officinale TaxID=94328 RepID=A0A8J5GZA0_ZINOF|nr:hypothetical protein ZIOFF_023564 [Zingiber officinale]